jgi:UDP-glucuronate decarboxylase
LTGTFDYIVHAASIASPTFYRKYPLETIETNVLGLKNLLELGKTGN